MINSYFKLQTFATASFIAAALCQASTTAVVIGSNTAPNDTSDTKTAADWLIFHSFWVILYQILAIVLLFLRIELLYTVVPVINWSIFLLVVRAKPAWS